jgi:anti-sigma regulatory factor (Ser/Thr protein kinase)
LEKEFPADSGHVAEMISFVEENLSGADSKDVYRMILITEEIVVNVASYAYEDSGGAVKISFDNDTEALQWRIVFEDQGRPFNPLEMESPDLNVPVRERKIGGLGIMLTKKIADEINYEYRDGKNILRVRKNYTENI